MSIQAVGLKAYTAALNNFAKAEKATQASSVTASPKTENNFSSVLSTSLDQVNSLQGKRSDMIKAFASGETQNVHELMISMQKASLAMNMTSAVRTKVIEAYKELSRMQF